MPELPTFQTGKLCYVEIPARDVHESADFYERAFGWNIRFRDIDRPSFDDTTLLARRHRMGRARAGC